MNSKGERKSHTLSSFIQLQCVSHWGSAADLWAIIGDNLQYNLVCPLLKWSDNISLDPAGPVRVGQGRGRLEGKGGFEVVKSGRLLGLLHVSV